MSSERYEGTLREISRLADQLAITIDDRFDLLLNTDHNDERLLKLVMMINFILERARENIDQLALAKTELEHKVEERTALLELVIRGSNDGVWLWHLDENRLDVSQRLAELSNQRVDSLQTLEAWTRLLHPDDVDGFSNAIRQYVNGVSEKLTCQYRISDGYKHYRWVVMRGALERDEDGNPRLLAGTQTDITPLIAVDQSSGLPNELAFNEWLSMRLTKNASAFVAVLSVDRFSDLAEALHGKQLEYVKAEIQRRIQKALPVSTFIAKFPNESFGIGLTNPSAQPRQLLSMLFTQFEHPVEVQGQGPIKMSISAGTLMLPAPMREVTTDACKASLWTALRQARLVEGNSLVEFDEELRDEQMRKLRVEGEIRTSLEDARVVAYLQPLVAASSYEVVGFEALVRVRSVDGGLIPPGDFIPVIENSDLIIPLTETVMREALAILRRFIESGVCGAATSVAVNIAPQHLVSGQLPDLVRRELDVIGLPPSALKLEVTETALMANMELAVDQLNRLRKFGCKVAIDDFGTGYSSLEYLHTLPVDILKLDRIFIQKMSSSLKTEAIARSICDLARLLELEIVAEGVEEQAEVDLLADMGATHLQGYFFCRPLPEDELRACIARRGARRAG
ncbi:MAG: EAL domain-containing protein [Halieaceae bacterium]|nr:EAL domain-containing protein [Halieaceae bacterium]